LNIDMAQGSKEILVENERVAKLINANKAARTSALKPSGTSSLVLGCSSGVHAWHNDYYIRRMRIGKNEPIYTYLKNNLPQLVEDEFFKPHIQAVISIPIKAPEGAILRTESPIDTLERVKKIHKEWISTGHRKGANTHNVSCTISVKDEEWQAVTDWMWENRECYSGISLLPYDGGTYIQAPFEDCSKEKFEELTQYLADVNLSMIVEQSDETNLSGELACAGGACQVDSLSSADSDEKQA
jgi:ribonucleoside-diphosphate reductase alpha chain